MMKRLWRNGAEKNNANLIVRNHNLTTNTMQTYSKKKHNKELKRKRKRKIVRLDKLRQTISKRRLSKPWSESSRHHRNACAHGKRCHSHGQRGKASSVCSHRVVTMRRSPEKNGKKNLTSCWTTSTHNSLSLNELRRGGHPRGVTPWQSTTYEG